MSPWVLLLVGLVCAGPEDAARARARAAYAAWQNAAGQPPPAPGAGDSDAMRRFKRSGPSAADVNRASFRTAFGRTDFDAWDPDADRELLREGLLLVARGAWLEGRADVAVRAGDLFVARFPDHDAVPLVRGYDLPAALVVAGDVDRALVLARAHAAGTGGVRGARALVLLGDLERVRGDGEAAAAAYERAFALTTDPDAGGPVDVRDADWSELDQRHANRVVRGEIRVRRERIGRRLGTLRRNGIGPVTDALGRGAHGVALWFFSPSKQADLEMLVALDGLARELGDDRLRVVGVTWLGNLASTRSAEGTDEHWIPGADGERLVVAPRRLEQQLTALRKRLDLAAPLAIVREEHAIEWAGKWEQRLLLVADRSHRVVFASREGEAAITLALVRAFARTPPD